MATVVNGVQKDPLIIDQNKEIDWAQYASDCGAHVFYPKTQTLIWIMNAQPDCSVKVKILDSVKVNTRL